MTDSDELEAPERTRIARPLLLFLATCLSVTWTGAHMALQRAPDTFGEACTGWIYALPLMAILTCHELGHYVAARLHGVPASLPYFLPLPVISPFGTMGAIIAMPERIRSRNALLDIGAAGPLAGMLVAFPVLLLGLSLSPIVEGPPGLYDQEGQSLFYWMSKRLVLGGMPEGHDVLLHPTAFAGWVGLFVTMINLVPWGQLDGGHIAYALLGPMQNRVARRVRTGLLLVFGYNLARFASPVLLGTSDMPLTLAIGNSMPWLVWFVLLGLMGRLLGREHPPCEPGRLSPGRRRVAVGCLLLFVLLFMPTPMTTGYRSPAEGQVDGGLVDGNLRSNASRTTSGA